MARRILVLSASVGAGHLRAAQAVELALRELVPGAVVKNLDVLQLTNPTFRKLYSEAYLEFVNKAPHVLGMFYDLLYQRRTKSTGACGQASGNDELHHVGASPITGEASAPSIVP